MEKKNNVVQPINGNVQIIGQTVARGTINNNPFNIVKTNITWLGKLKGLFSTDSKFEQFETLGLGIRAGLLNLKNGYKSKGFNTPQLIISRYAPLSDNNPISQNNYISAIALVVFGLPSSVGYRLSTTEHWLRAAYGILRFENGVSPVTYDQLVKVNNDYKVIV